MALCAITQKAAYIFLCCIYRKGGKVSFLSHLKGKVGGTAETHGTSLTGKGRSLSTCMSQACVEDIQGTRFFKKGLRTPAYKTYSNKKRKFLEMKDL